MLFRSRNTPQENLLLLRLLARRLQTHETARHQISRGYSRFRTLTLLGLLVLDDLMEEGGNDKRVSDLFTKHSHHQNVTVIYLCQDMFPPGKFAKSISRSVHYIVGFKNPRNQLGMRNLLLQSFPMRWQEVQQTFRKVTE